MSGLEPSNSFKPFISGWNAGRGGWCIFTAIPMGGYRGKEWGGHYPDPDKNGADAARRIFCFLRSHACLSTVMEVGF